MKLLLLCFCGSTAENNVTRSLKKQVIIFHTLCSRHHPKCGRTSSNEANRIPELRLRQAGRHKSTKIIGSYREAKKKVKGKDNGMRIQR